MINRVHAVVLSLLLAGMAETQFVTRIEVTLLCENAGDEIAIVLNDNESKRYPARRVAPGKYLNETIEENADDIHSASVRFVNGRTGCAKPIKIGRRAAGYTAEFTFQCLTSTWRSLKASAEPRHPIHYMREMPANEDLETVIPCLESGSYLLREIEHLAPYHERVFLHIGPYEKQKTPDTNMHLLIQNGAFAGKDIVLAPRSFGKQTIEDEYAARKGRPRADNMKDIVGKFLPAGFKKLVLQRSE